MIPTIGLMIGLYIITRMTSFLTRGGERSESIVVKVFAVITTLVTFLCILDLLRIGIQT
ncbi:hypothetical protein ES708_15136 [subsurface metagenome]